MAQAEKPSSTRRAVLGAVLLGVSTSAIAVAAPAAATSPAAAPDLAGAGECLMSIPVAHAAIFKDLAARLGAPGELAYPEGWAGEGKILVWVDEDAWRGLLSAATAMYARRTPG